MKMNSPVLRVAVIFIWMSASVVMATEEQIQELEKEVAEIRSKIQSLASEHGALKEIASNLQTAEKQISEAKESLPQLEQAISNKEFLLDAYRSAFRTVTKFSPGEDLGSFVLKSGETVEPSSFVSAAKGTILVQGATGSRSIPVELLPDVFAAKVLLPPDAPVISGKLADLVASKSETVFGAAKSRTESPRVASAPPVQATPDPNLPDYDAIRKRNEARQNEINELKLRFSELFLAKKNARSDKSAAEKVFREAKIKKSPTEVASTLKIHDDKISRIEEEENQLRLRIARLQSQME